MQLHSRFGALREKPSQYIENDFGEAVQRIKMHAIERDIHDAREEAFYEHRPAHELSHEAPYGAVFAERHERTKIAVDVRLQRFAFQAPDEIVREVRRLLVRGL